MRAAILIVVVLVLGAAALVRPRIGLLAYVWFSLMHPDYFAFGKGAFPFSPVLAGATLIGCIRYLPWFDAIFRNPVTRMLVLYQIPIAASVYFALSRELAWGPFAAFERMILMVLLIPILFRDRETLDWLLLVVALSIGTVGAYFGLTALAHGGLYIWQGYGALDNNGMALAFTMGIPFCWYLRMRSSSRILRAVLLVMVFSSASAVIMTKSRGGSLALGTTMILIALRSRNRIRVLAGLAILILPVLYVFGEQYFERMGTLRDPLSDASAASRIVFTKVALRMWMDHPWTGVGFGNTNFIANQHRYMGELENEKVAVDAPERGLKAHNTYAQVLVDSGIFAFLLFLYLLFGTIYRLWRSERICRKESPGLEVYPIMLQTPLIALAQYGLTGGREMYDFLYITLAAAGAWLAIQRRLATPAGPEQPASTPEPEPVETGRT